MVMSKYLLADADSRFPQRYLKKIISAGLHTVCIQIGLNWWSDEDICRTPVALSADRTSKIYSECQQRSRFQVYCSVLLEVVFLFRSITQCQNILFAFNWIISFTCGGWWSWYCLYSKLWNEIKGIASKTDQCSKQNLKDFNLTKNICQDPI